MRLILTCAIILYNLLANAQDVYPDKVSVTKTSEHINIPGTKIFIIPPAGYTIAKSFVGLEKGYEAMIQFYDLVGGNFYTNSATFNPEEFKEKGLETTFYKKYMLNEYPAKYIVLKNNDDKQMNLVFGDTTFSVLTLAFYKSGNTSAEQELQKAFNSIYYDKSMPVNPFANKPYTIDDSKSKFKFVKSAAGLLLFSLDGIDKESYKNEPMVIVMNVPHDYISSPEDICSMMLRNYTKNGFELTKKISGEEIKINGDKAFESVYHGTLQQEEKFIYQLAVTSGTYTVTLQATFSSDYDNNLAEIRNLSHTIKIK